MLPLFSRKQITDLRMDKTEPNQLIKVPSGIEGLDKITHGGFPQGRPVLVSGGPGCGKTLLGMQFLIEGISAYNEPGVLMSFEETPADLAKNVSSMGIDLDKLQKEGMLKIDYVKIDSSEIEETGEYDLEGLFVRLNYAIDIIGAKRVVLDTIEALFGGLNDLGILRSELRRLFQWLKTKGVTALITAEKGKDTFTRQGLEEYISDCVILLDFRVINELATRRLRVVKYRGSTHGTNEYPFLIDNSGISVMPVTDLKLDYPSVEEVISTGLPALDDLFYKGGLYRGSGTLITGKAGTSKTILASYSALGSCKRNEKVLFFSFEESPGQIVRNLKSIGVDFQPYIDRGLLEIHSSRPSLNGLEFHLFTLIKIIEELEPKTVIVDPITSLLSIGSRNEVRTMIIRMIDFLKNKQINAVFTSLSDNQTDNVLLSTMGEVSSLADNWIHLKNVNKHDNELCRSLVIIKSRGMGYSNKEQKFKITNSGIVFED